MSQRVVLYLSFFALIFGGCALNRNGEQLFDPTPYSDAGDSQADAGLDSETGAWPESGGDVLPDVPDDVVEADAPDDVQPDTPEDVVEEDSADDVVEADAPDDVQPDTPEDVVEEDVQEDSPADAPLTHCETYGSPGKITITATFSINPSSSLALWGEVIYPSTANQDLPWDGMCWSEPGDTFMVCTLEYGPNDPLAAVKDAVVRFQPQRTNGPGQNPVNSLCGADTCANGTYVVCAGLVEACRAEGGVLSGSAEYFFENSSDHEPDISCKLP